MIQRIVTAAVLAPLVVLATLYLPTPYVAALAAALFLGGLWEWSHLVGIERKTWRGLYLIANCVLMTGLLWARALPLFTLVSLIGVAWWLAALVWLLRPGLGRDAGVLARAGKLVAGTLAIVPAWCALVLLHKGDGTLAHPDPLGPRWLLLALLIVWAADSGAYALGSTLGKRKLVPAISPGKTWMGLWGGIASGLAVGLLAMDWVHVKPAQWQTMVALALVTVAASVIGDLFESLMKRHSGLKDSGTLFPGHGGVLDRIDSLLAALPVLWI
ncbi:MAG: phosphatidate cytidylyltransferase, partial [Proteobacteria bacterium]|nr:phosphatidate cytidylyltransferase [Pseudomonadota bacterium]